MEKDNKIKEEFTTKQHSEFTVSKKGDIKNRCFSALTLISNVEDKEEVEKWAKSYGVTYEDVMSTLPRYLELRHQSK